MTQSDHEHNGNEQEKLFSRTHEVCLELSNMCNMSHLHTRCPVHTLADQRNILSGGIVRNVLGTLGSHDFTGRISFHTYNEPLIDPRLFEFVRMARRLCPASDIHITTNGGYLTQGMAAELVDAGVSSFFISAYSDSEKRRFDEMHIDADVTVQRMHLDDRLALYDGPENACEKPCYAPLSQVIVTAKGKINLCCLDWKREYCFGDLNRQSFEEAMRDEAMRKTYQRLSRGERFLPLCRRCNWSRGKPQGMPAGAARETALPEPVSVTVSDGRRMKLDIVADLVDFTGLDRPQVERLLQRRGYTARDEFRDCTVREDNDAWFYLGSRYFIFENAVHQSHIDPAVLRLLPEGGSVWEYGGGTGNISLTLAARGYEASYTELNSLQKDFVAMRARKHALPVTNIDCWGSKPVERFDLVLALDVLEHISDYDRVLVELCAAVKPGGTLWETSAFQQNPANPTHRIADEHDFRRMIADLGFEREYGCDAGRLWRKTGRERSRISPKTVRAARQCAITVAKNCPADEAVIFELSRGFEELAAGEFPLALDYFEEARRLYPAVSGPQFFAMIYEIAEKTAGKLPEIAQAIAAGDRTGRYALIKTIGSYGDAVGLAESGVRKLNSGDPAGAMLDFDEALNLCGHLPQINYARAAACLKLGKLGSAKHACMQELKNQPGHAPARNLLARLEEVMKSTTPK